MIVLFNDNVDKILRYLEKNYARKPKVTIRIMEDYDSIQRPSGEMGFGVFDVINQTIYAATDIPEPYNNIPYTIAHEYKHYLQWCDGKPFDEKEADQFADKILEELGIVYDYKTFS